MLLLVLALAWAAIGAAGVAVMRHRGHDWFAWAIPFVVLGPLAVPLAVSADRHRPAEPPRPLPPGGLDVLVCHDGSAGATAALDAALQLLGGRITSLTLAAVVDFEAPTTARGRDTEREAQQRLDALAGDVASRISAPVATVVLYGDAAHALGHFAADKGYELVVEGCQAAGRAHRNGIIPVLIGPAAE